MGKGLTMADTSKFWAWFDATRDAAIVTEDGKVFHAAGFDLTHTGGGCTAWQRAIDGTPWLIWIATDDAGHSLSRDELEAGGSWFTWVMHSEDSSVSQAIESTSAYAAALIGDNMADIVKAGRIDTLGMSYDPY